MVIQKAYINYCAYCRDLSQLNWKSTLYVGDEKEALIVDWSHSSIGSIIEGLNRECTELATPRGFEPLISTVTGWHVRPLHHGAIKAIALSEPWSWFKSIRGDMMCQIYPVRK